MEDAQRWSVTYTKHVKQKRKVYQDGFLELQSSRHKVMLLDEWDKLLESRFVKKDDVIKSGETLAFECYLVDIGELCGGYKPTSTLNQGKDRKVEEKSGSFYSSNSESNSVSIDRKSAFWRKKERVICLSPSQKMIRDFKKGEMNKFGSSPTCMDITKSSTTGFTVSLASVCNWLDFHTFHNNSDAYFWGQEESQLEAASRVQVMLYDMNRRQLDSRFLKKDEIVCSGESLSFEGHLVEIGEEEGDHKPVTYSNLQGKYCKVVGKTDLANHQAKIPTNNKFPAGKSPDKTSPAKLNDLNDSSSKVKNAKLSRSNPANEPRRAVHDILSILRQPIHRKVTMNKSSVEERPELHSSDVCSDNKNPIKEFVEECSGSAREELREKTSDHDHGIKVLKPEAVEVLVAAETCTVSENGRESQARSSDFCLRSGTTNHTVRILDVEFTDHNKSVASSLSKDVHALEAAGLDSECQTPIESATLTRSNKNEEPESPPEICPYEDIMSEPNAAATNVFNTSKLPKPWKDKGSSSTCHEAASSVSTMPSNDCTSQDLSGTDEKTLKLDFHTKEKDELPSFDLGF
ncbi:hypothetical protein Sango_1133800 [Sesamum angolense]|uniref:5'-3' DNA helicase ZGRF1-like N-terminal domain-containing protein n=1 Tax=Sesamum angolense TaxID=2727404 RepID=A0AAE2BWE0_9LAMI|nr:hypothetical protein Sango_1133800 [Sesamum angolense]